MGVVNIQGYDLKTKTRKVAEVILKYKDDPTIERLAFELGDPDKIYQYVKSRVRYVLEKGTDLLFEPITTLMKGYGDCEDMTALIGALNMALGYPVRLVVVVNATKHIYPMVFVNGKWKRYDAVPKSRVIPKEYKVAVDLVIQPSGIMRFRKAEEESLTDVSGLGMLGKWVEVKNLDEPVREGDRLRIHLKPKWYLPTWLEVWLYKLILRKKYPYFEIEKIVLPSEVPEHEYIVYVRVKKQEEVGSLVLTVALIATAIIGGGLLAYLTISKIEKFVPQQAVADVSKGLMFFGLAFLLSNIAKFMPEREK